MTRVLEWIRKSKGSDDDIGLEDQREKVGALSKELTDDVDDIDSLDLGVHTGFSSMTREDPAGLLDQNSEVINAVERLRNGEYDYVTAYDDRRICRDEYFTIIEYACKQGGAEIVYYADVDDDNLAFDIHRRVERETKEEEIRKAKRALERRRAKGYWEGRPRWGTEYDDNSAYLVPSENFGDALLAIQMKKVQDASYNDILDKTAIGSTGTLRNILDRADWYLDLASEHDVDVPELPVVAVDN